jgi:phage FluMu gp28-like protein
MLTDTLAPVTERRSEQEKQIRLMGGGVLDFWSLDNPDAIRGRKYARFMVNEAAFVPDLMHIWNMVIRPTLIDLKGDAYFSGTPKGQNGYWQLFNQTGDDWQHWQMSSYSNPHIPATELDALKDTMTERAFTQEILAQFLEDGGGVFRHVQAAAIATEQDKGEKDHQYTIGADWGRSNDATVFAVLDMTTRKCVFIDRMTDTDYAAQRVRLIVMAQRFNMAACLVETNSIGMPQLEELQRMGLAAQGFQTSNTSKAQIIDALALAFEQNAIEIINDPVLVAELMAYQSERLPSGLLRYGAPEGMHDDTVIALALAWWGGFAGNNWIMS